MMAALLLRGARAHGQLYPVETLFRSAAAALHCSSSLRRRDFLITNPDVKAKLIDGQKMAKTVREEVAAEVKKMVKDGKRAPHLVAVLATDDPASDSYVSRLKVAKKCGINATTLRKETILEEELLELIKSLNEDNKVDGILVLPTTVQKQKGTVLNTVAPEKDVDAFHTLNIGKYCAGKPGFMPSTVLGILEILKRCEIPTFGKNVCVVNRTKHLGFPLATLLHSDGTGDATTTICHEYTPPEQLSVMTKLADIVIVGTGIPGLIKGDMVKEGAAVIDFATTMVEQEDGSSKLVGDVEVDSVAQVASLLTPVPGGVGPMTVAMLLRNTLFAAQKQYTFDFKSIKE